jgi:Flp pilus assembly pilin Flp
MFEILKKLREESGQDLAEYGIALVVIAAGAAAIAIAIGSNVNSLWSNAQTQINNAATTGAQA